MNKLIRDVLGALHELSEGPLRVSMEHVLRRYDAAANAEPAPLSSVPEGATKEDSPKRCVYCFQTVTEAQANHVLATESAFSTRVESFAREAGRRERDAEVAALQDCLARVTAERDEGKAIIRAIEGHLGLMPGEDVVACVKDCLTQQRERIDAELYMQERDAFQEDLARVTAERDKEKKRMSELVDLLQDIGKALIDAERACLGDALEALPAAVSLLTREYDEARSALAEAQAEVERHRLNTESEMREVESLYRERTALRAERDDAHAAGKRQGIKAALAAVRRESLAADHCPSENWKPDNEGDEAYEHAIGDVEKAIRSLLSEPEEVKRPGGWTCAKCNAVPSADVFSTCWYCGAARPEPAPEASPVGEVGDYACPVRIYDGPTCPACHQEHSPVGEGRDWILAALTNHDEDNLRVWVTRLKGSDGEGWAIGETVERYLNMKGGAYASGPDPRAVPETPPQVSQDAAPQASFGLTPDAVADWCASPEGREALAKARAFADVTIAALNEARQVKNPGVKLTSEAGGDLVARLRDHAKVYTGPSPDPWPRPSQTVSLLSEAADALEGAESEVARRITEAVAETFDWCATNAENTMRRFNSLSEGWRALEVIRHAIRARAKKGDPQ